MLKWVSGLPLPASSSGAGDAAPSQGRLSLQEHLVLPKGLKPSSPSPSLGKTLLCFALPQASSRLMLSLVEILQKYPHFGSKTSTHVLKLPLTLQLSFCGSSAAKGKSGSRSHWRRTNLRWETLLARCWTSSQAECAICFPVLDLAYNFLFQQPVTKLTDKHIHLHRACRAPPHEGLLSPGPFQRSWMAPPQSPALLGVWNPLFREAHPAFLPYPHRPHLLRIQTGSTYPCKTFHQHKWGTLEINGESRSWRFWPILCQWRHIPNL